MNKSGGYQIRYQGNGCVTSKVETLKGNRKNEEVLVMSAQLEGKEEPQ